MLFKFMLHFLIRKLTNYFHDAAYPVVFGVKNQPGNPV